MTEEDTPYALPLPERRDRLVAGFANLVRKQGFETLVQAPLLRADEECFPDEFALTRRGVARLIRRILAYAGLGHLTVDLDVDSGVHVDDAGNAIAAAEYVPPAWFAGIEGTVCRFGIDVSITRDPDQLVAILCHEVAHAFREYHGLRTQARDVEEALTDLTTVYLGFGLLTTNATFRYTTHGEIRGGYTFTYRNLSRAGYLDPGEMSLLLALHATARESRPAELRAIRADLGATQAELFDEALEWFSSEGKQHLEQLALPPRAEWPPERGVAEACVNLSELDDLPDTPLFEEKPLGRDVNKGRRVFRIERRRTWVGLLVGFPFALFAWGLMPFGEVGNTALCLMTLPLLSAIRPFDRPRMTTGWRAIPTPTGAISSWCVLGRGKRCVGRTVGAQTAWAPRKPERQALCHGATNTRKRVSEVTFRPRRGPL